MKEAMGKSETLVLMAGMPSTEVLLQMVELCIDQLEDGRGTRHEIGDLEPILSFRNLLIDTR